MRQTKRIKGKTKCQITYSKKKKNIKYKASNKMRHETDEVNKAMSTKMKLVLFDLNSHFIRIFSIGY